MDSLISYLLILPIVSFLGLYAGLLIGWMAKEELKSGKKILTYLQILLLLSIIFFLFFDFTQFSYLVFFFGLPTGSLFYLESKKKDFFSLIKGITFKYWYFLPIIIVAFGLRLIL
ncbi:MAG: hypothetical protein ABIB43_00300 [archaeon]